MKKPLPWSVNVSAEIPNLRIDLRSVKSLAKRVINETDFEHLPSFVREFSVTFITDSQMKSLNSSYRKKNKTTDVLSFSMIEGLTDQYATPAALGSSLGEIAISHVQAFRQCKKFGTTPNQEIIRLLVHGILHLLGYDHENVSPFEASKMRTVENLLFNKFKSVKVLK